jgi:hypothetical protein
MDKRIQYIHNYLVARAWYMAQILPMPEGYWRQIDNAVAWYFWRVQLPRSTVHNPTEETAMWMEPYKHMCQKPSTVEYTSSDNCATHGKSVAEMGSSVFGRKFPSYSKDSTIPGVRTSIWAGQRNGVGKQKRHISAASILQWHTCQVWRLPSSLMRIDRLWPNTDWPMVWKNVQAIPALKALKVQLYKVIHELLPTN